MKYAKPVDILANMSSNPVIGLDFGTTNSAIAADAKRQAKLAVFNNGESTTTSYRSILYFPPKEQKLDTKAGPVAKGSRPPRPGKLIHGLHRFRR